MAEPAEKVTGSEPVPLRCLECESIWVEPDERWRVYVTNDDPPLLLAYCPACATREFD